MCVSHRIKIYLKLKNERTRGCKDNEKTKHHFNGVRFASFADL